MKIQQQDVFHGAALTQIVEYPRFKALSRASDGKHGHYVLNNDTELFVKYSTGVGPEFRFNLSLEDGDAIAKAQFDDHYVLLYLYVQRDDL